MGLPPVSSWIHGRTLFGADETGLSTVLSYCLFFIDGSSGEHYLHKKIGEEGKTFVLTVSLKSTNS